MTEESAIRPPEILSPKGSAFLADMRSHEKIFRKGFTKQQKQPKQSPTSRTIWTSKQRCLVLSILDGNPKHPRQWFAVKTDDDCNALSLTPKTSNKSKKATLSSSQISINDVLNILDSHKKRTDRRNAPGDGHWMVATAPPRQPESADEEDGDAQH